MTDNIRTIVSMIAGEDKLTLITIKGELIDISNGDMYDTEKMVDDLTPKLTGLGGVEVDLDDFLIIKQALFPQDYENEGDIIVRVVEGKEVKGIFFPLKIEVSVKIDGNEVVIPEAQHLTGQMSRAIDQNSPSVANFLRRIAVVAAERRHSAEDLMKFIRHCDLPLTDAGDIIAYKRVSAQGSAFVDCHSHSVVQNLGYRVYTDVERVDPDRSRACSNGLHVGSLQFMKSFWGGSTLVCLVRPEDFIAVPTYDEKKCRVCSYDIIGILSPEDRDKVNTGEHIENSPFNIMIGNAVAGDTIPMTMATYVKGPRDTVVHKINEDPNKTKVEPVSEEQAAAKGASLETDTGQARGKQVLEKAKAAKATGIQGQARELFNAASWPELLAFKKTKKKSWMSLGFSEAEIEIINNPPEDVVEDIADEESADDVISDIVEDVIASKADEPATDLPKVPEPKEKSGKATIAEQAQAMYEAGRYEELRLFKKAKKKSWKALGISEHAIGQIEKD